MAEKLKVDSDIKVLEDKIEGGSDIADDKKKLAKLRLRDARIEVECKIEDKNPDNAKWNEVRELIGLLEEAIEPTTSEDKAAVRVLIDKLYDAASKAGLHAITKPDLEDLLI